MEYIKRYAEKEMFEFVGTFPAVVLIGPRQVGKTSLVKHLVKQFTKQSMYLDLENPEDINKLSNPALFLTAHEDQTVIIDEVQRIPALFPVLRSLIDQNRQPGRFILLGSASPDLIRDTSESLAGRVTYLELQPFSSIEIPVSLDFRQHWLRGGFPESLFASDDSHSLTWRENFVRTYLERDLPLLGLKADPMLIRRLWSMIAHLNGQLLNLASLSNSLDLSAPTVRRYLDFLESAFLIRRLHPWFTNTKKRLVRTPKIYLRDTGLLHALLRIENHSQLLGHPVLGASWESYIIQEIITCLPPRSDIYFYRTHEGTEADVVITRQGIPEILIEVKYSVAPKPSKGFYIAQKDLSVKKNFIIYPVSEGYPLTNEITVLSHKELDNIFK